MSKRKRSNYLNIIKNKKFPILTLDSRWHELFPDELKSSRIKELEQKVNQLLKKQGKMVNDIKDMKKLKKSLLSDIVTNMETANDLHSKSREKRVERNKRFIYELNNKIDRSSERLSELPYKIKEANEELLLESLKNCYERLNNNHKELENISKWIKKTRDELKTKILAKNDIEADINKIYTYMHDVLGSDIIEIFDLKHNPINPDKRNTKE